MKGPTQQYSDTIKSLQSRIQALEDENRLLKERLEEAGVSYANIVSGDAEGVVELYDPDQGARIKKFDVTDKIASDFFMMFCRGRKDVYDLRYTNPKTGKNGYYTQCFNRWDRGCHIQKKDGVRCKDCELRAYKPVTLPLIKAHMNGTDPNGNDVVAIYPMLENNLCQLLVFDFDNHAKGAEQEDYANIDDGWKEEINALRHICKNLDVDAVVERVKPEHLRLDFSGITFMDSSGVGLIMGRYRLMNLLGGTVSVTGCSDRVRKMLALAGMDRLKIIQG